jgi:cell filamentation protein
MSVIQPPIQSTNKISIRFFDDREVRAIWDDANSKWWFSVVDVISAITQSPRPRKYWNALKTKLQKEGNELSSKLGQLKLLSTDGKKYATQLYSAYLCIT